MQQDKTAHQQMADDGASMPWQNHHSHHHYYSPSSPSKKAVPNFANLHFKTFLELIATLYERETDQIVRCSREFTDPNCEGLYDFVFRNRAISVLYNPQVRTLQEECYPKMLAGVPTERINRNQEIIFQMCKWMVILSVFISAHNFAMMLYGTKEKPLWPYTLFMEKSD